MKRLREEEGPATAVGATIGRRSPSPPSSSSASPSSLGPADEAKHHPGEEAGATAAHLHHHHHHQQQQQPQSSPPAMTLQGADDHHISQPHCPFGEGASLSALLSNKMGDDPDDMTTSSTGLPPQGGLPAVPPSSNPPSSSAASSKSRATSCETCRLRKVKCEPRTPDGEPYPCARCTRLKLSCERPKVQESQHADEAYARHRNLIKLWKALVQQQDADLERIKAVLCFFSKMYCRTVLTGKVPTDSMEATHYREVMRNLLGRFSLDLNAYLSTLSMLDGPDSILIDGHYLTNQGHRTQSLHPYVATMFEGDKTTLAFVAIQGVCRFIANETFQKHFFTEEEAQRAWDEKAVLPPVIIGSVLCPQERPRFERSTRDLMVEVKAPVADNVYIFKVCLRKVGLTVNAMVQNRIVMLEGGNYFVHVVSFTPLPIPAGPPKKASAGTRRPGLQWTSEDDPWVECGRAFGDATETLCLMGVNAVDYFVATAETTTTTTATTTTTTPRMPLYRSPTTTYHPPPPPPPSASPSVGLPTPTVPWKIEQPCGVTLSAAAASYCEGGFYCGSSPPQPTGPPPRPSSESFLTVWRPQQQPLPPSPPPMAPYVQHHQHQQPRSSSPTPAAVMAYHQQQQQPPPPFHGEPPLAGWMPGCSMAARPDGAPQQAPVVLSEDELGALSALWEEDQLLHQQQHQHQQLHHHHHIHPGVTHTLQMPLPPAPTGKGLVAFDA